jgi:hypothetical protein
MNFDGAEGYLVREPHKGLMAMFVMMNTARLAVGLQGLGLSDRALQNAVVYANERLQMRAATGAKFPEKPADPIIVHPDVRRMLLTGKALVEGGRALAYDAALQFDIATHGGSEDERAEADALVGFLTPIVKGCLTEWSVEVTYDALQCFGGHGYIHEHGMEQLARDARITTLYEGTTGIQALDLLGRKVMQLKGAGLKAMLARIRAFADAGSGDAELDAYRAILRDLATQWQALSVEIAQRSGENADELGAASYDYLMFSGYVCLAYWWARSVEALPRASTTAAFADGKRATARFYFDRILPRTTTHAAAIRSGAASLMVLDAAAFDAGR